MDISQSQKDDVTVVALAGRFDAQSAGDVEDSLNTALDGGAKKILVDMGDIEYISSAGLRVLLSTAKKISWLERQVGAMRTQALCARGFRSGRVHHYIYDPA
jgi:anti-anti-sigma factor